MNLIGTLEIGEEYGVCTLLVRGLLFCIGGGAPTCKMTPNCKPTSTSKPALPINHPILRMGGAFLQSASHSISSSHPFLRMGGDALSMHTESILEPYGTLLHHLKKKTSSTLSKHLNQTFTQPYLGRTYMMRIIITFLPLDRRLAPT